MQVSRDIYQLLAEHISDYETWRTFSCLCKNSHNVAKSLWPQKKLEFAIVQKSNTVRFDEKNILECCNNIVFKEGQTIDYYTNLPTNKWLFYSIFVHKNDIVLRTKFFNNKVTKEKIYYRHDGTIIKLIEFIQNKNGVNIYNLTWYYPDGKTISYQGKVYGSDNDQYKIGCWNKFTEDGKLVVTEYWSESTHELDHVTFHNNTNTNNYNYDTIACVDPLDSSSSLEIDSYDSSEENPMEVEEKPRQPIKEDTFPLMFDFYEPDDDGTGGAAAVTRFEYDSDPDTAEWASLDSSVESLELSDGPQDGPIE